jgi:hypothetical protein
MTEQQFLNFRLDHYYQRSPFHIRGFRKTFTVAEALSETARANGAKDVPVGRLQFSLSSSGSRKQGRFPSDSIWVHILVPGFSTPRLAAS